MPHGDERTQVDLQETDDPNFYRYRCPETFRMKQVAADAVAVFDVNTNRLLNELADLLNIAQVLRAGIQRPRVERTLWKLGDARIGPALTPVWLVPVRRGHGLARTQRRSRPRHRRVADA